MVQSPISISLRSSKIVDKIKPLQYYGYWETSRQAFIENTGTSAKITFLSSKTQPYLSGGPLKPNENYIFVQMHFHWAENDAFGSEHTINEQTYSMEIHLVHFNAKYGSFDKAVIERDGLVVVAFFVQAYGDVDCHFFKKITDYVPTIRKTGSKTAIDPDCMQWMSLQELNKHYYTYYGSLTTAPYNECVTWIIYRTPVFVSKQQVAAFRDLSSIDHNMKIGRNCRPLQTITFHNPPLVLFTRNVQLKSKL